MLYYATGPCTTSPTSGQRDEIIGFELAELLSEWWFPLYTHPGRTNLSKKLGYIVRGGIEAGGQMNCPRTAGLRYTNKNQQ